ncbi:histidine triad nucleotide-binding protein [Pasteuria penetrans]|uniref:histidine triad nucleotide-binding protein n=1 Tax=Pasteuria penetrans TaxID=86005 RepID=UPI000FBE1765|nr:histidine triad nucleotide-binding protein [Pasteuria penetrans]
MQSCLFCQIVRNELSSRRVYEDGEVLAFHDTMPVAPTHVLVIPKQHLSSFVSLDEAESSLAGKLLQGVRATVRALGLEEGGFRIVVNVGEDGGQTVQHLHFHVLAGRPLAWPPG